MKKKVYRAFMLLCFVLAGVLPSAPVQAQDEDSVARIWNKELLFAITQDFARPPVHARNLFHLSIAHYDAWAACNSSLGTYLLGQQIGNYTSVFEGFPMPAELEAARAEAISYASYRLISHRFSSSPGFAAVFQRINALMQQNGYDPGFTSTDYQSGSAAALGNYVAAQVIEYGFQDGANEEGDYQNLFYEPVNPKIEVEQPGNPNMLDPNRWQTISLTIAIDQAGNPLTNDPTFVGAEWGLVQPFALTLDDVSIYERDGYIYPVYLDPGDPAYLDTSIASGLEDLYKWNHLLVSVWQSHLDPEDETLWDISPASIGNIQAYPETLEDFPDFYNFWEGGDPGIGHLLNPATEMPYEPQVVKRADYGRILAEFWADGPESETPPGHWFSIYHQVSEHPLFERKWNGQCVELGALEYDVKAHLALGGALHDAAVTAWSIKGWYDYVRPVSAIRYMADRGQSSDENLPGYHPAGVPLLPGYIELVEPGDSLSGLNGEHVGKIKLYTWRGPDYIDDPEVDVAGVGWILAENWWPYQRPTFVTPPFAGYISGHSTYSSAAAELLTWMTGDPYFPGGMGEFECPEGEFLEFEYGPSENITLQWATYRDASDQCSLSRIWGGIHPPVDDIAGRVLGQEVGYRAYEKATQLFEVGRPRIDSLFVSHELLTTANTGSTFELGLVFDADMDTDGDSPVVEFTAEDPSAGLLGFVAGNWINEKTFVLSYEVGVAEVEYNDIQVQLSGSASNFGVPYCAELISEVFAIDTKRPVLTDLTGSSDLLTEAQIGEQAWALELLFDEPMDPAYLPDFAFVVDEDTLELLSLNLANSAWLDDTRFEAVFDLDAEPVSLAEVDVHIRSARDLAGNAGLTSIFAALVSIETTPVQTRHVNAAAPLVLFPNPLSRQQALKFELDVAAQDLELVVSNLIGEVVYKESHLSLNSGIHSINLPILPPGVYFVNIGHRDGRQAGKLLVN